MALLFSAAMRSSSSAMSSCFLKCSISSGWIRSSSRVFSSWYLRQSVKSPQPSPPHPSSITLHHRNGTQDSLLPMMNLVLILIIPMVPRAHPKIRQCAAPAHKDKPLVPRHQPVPIPVQQLDDLLHRPVLVRRVDVVRAVVLEAVRRVQLIKVPVPAVVEVVQLEEGPRVEVRDVVLFCRGGLAGVAEGTGLRGGLGEGEYQLNAASPSRHARQLRRVVGGRRCEQERYLRGGEPAPGEKGGGRPGPLLWRTKCVEELLGLYLCDINTAIDTYIQFVIRVLVILSSTRIYAPVFNNRCAKRRQSLTQVPARSLLASTPISSTKPLQPLLLRSHYSVGTYNPCSQGS